MPFADEDRAGQLCVSLQRRAASRVISDLSFRHQRFIDSFLILLKKHTNKTWSHWKRSLLSKRNNNVKVWDYQNTLELVHREGCALSLQEVQLSQYRCICYLGKCHKKNNLWRVSYMKSQIYFHTMNGSHLTIVLWLVGIKSLCVDMV